MMRLFILLSLFIGSASFCIAQKKCGHNHMRKVGGGMMTDPANLRSDTLNILSYDVSLDMTQMNSGQLAGHCTVDFAALMDNQDHINLDLEGLLVDSVSMAGQNLVYAQANNQLWIGLPSVLNTGDATSLKVSYHGSPVQDPTWGGFYFSSGYAFNLGVAFDSEPHNYGRVWHPCFDNFVERASYNFHVLTNNGRTAYCNGIRTGLEIVGQDSLLTHWQLNETIPSYLASVAVGNYVHAESSFVNYIGDPIPVYLTAKAQDTLDMKTSMENLIPWIEYAEEKYGPYVWPRIGFCAVPFNGGAMEHATNIAYPLYAIDGTLSYETLMAHESAHHWWGDLITCETAGDMWINEGMASYSEALFMEGLYGQEAYQNYVKENFKEVITQAHRRDGGYYALADIPSEITYGDHVYNKGALVGHNLRHQLGDVVFFDLIQNVMSSYAFQSISTIELRDYWQTLTLADVTTFFENFILQPGMPEYRLKNAAPFAPNIWYLQFEQFSHHLDYPCEDVFVEVTAVDDDGNKVRADFFLHADISNYYMSLPEGFNPQHFYLNEDERIYFAVLPEEKWITATGSNDFDFAEMDMDVNSFGNNDSLWVRVENHWAATDELQMTTGYHLSTDRWWSVMISGDGSQEIEADIRYYGADNQTNYFDPTFFETMFAAGLNEDSLVLMFRASPMVPWQEHTNYDVITLPGLTNGTGRIHINQLVTGEYCWAFRDPSNAVGESHSPQFAMTQIGQQVRIVCPHMRVQIGVYDSAGKRIRTKNCVDGDTIDLRDLPAGQYTLKALQSPYPSLSIIHQP